MCLGQMQEVLLRKSVKGFFLSLSNTSPLLTAKLLTLEMITVNLISTEVTVLWITSKLLLLFINPCNQDMCSVTKMDAIESGCRSKRGTWMLWM